MHSFVRYSPEEKRNLNLTGLKLLLLNSTKDLSVSSLKNEAYVIRKLIYKMAGPFRRQKHFQWLQVCFFCSVQITIH